MRTLEDINAELEQYSPDLAKRPQIVAANKVDIMTDPENLERLRAHVEATGSPRGKEIRSASPRHALFESPDSLKRYFSNLGPDALPLPRALRGKIPLNFPP